MTESQPVTRPVHGPAEAGGCGALPAGGPGRQRGRPAPWPAPLQPPGPPGGGRSAWIGACCRLIAALTGRQAANLVWAGGRARSGAAMMLGGSDKEAPPKLAAQNGVITVEIEALFLEHRGFHGDPRIRAAAAQRRVQKPQAPPALLQDRAGDPGSCWRSTGSAAACLSGSAAGITQWWRAFSPRSGPGLPGSNRWSLRTIGAN